MQPADPDPRFHDIWRKSFGDAPPLGWVLRGAYPERWTRFHGLPGARRYPQSDEDRRTIRARANALAEACFGAGAGIWLAAGFWETDRHPPNQRGIYASLPMLAQYDWVDPAQPPEDQVTLSVEAVELRWDNARLDWLFDAIAEDETRAVLFSPTRSTVLAPYDGGFDIVGRDRSMVADLEFKFSRWLPARADRL